jgi:hypothetical protein
MLKHQKFEALHVVVMSAPANFVWSGFSAPVTVPRNYSFTAEILPGFSRVPMENNRPLSEKSR